MKVAVFQCDLAGRSTTARLQRLHEVAAGTDADLLLCPELFMSGYHIGDAALAMAEAVDGAFAREVAKIARTTATAIIYGYPERASDTVYNAALCIGPDGHRLANHRKLVIPPGPEIGRFGPGDGLTLFDHAGMRCAILICYDAEFPETVRAAAQAGAQLILVPTALAAEWSVVAERVIPARAFENGVHIAYANHAGAENGLDYAGSSVILDPKGADQARAGAGEAVISGIVAAENVTGAQARLPYLRDLDRLRHKLT